MIEERFTSDELTACEKVAGYIVKIGMTTPAIFFLELNKPLNYVGSQALALFEPFIKAFVLDNQYGSFVNFLEKRSSVETMIRMIEDLDDKKRAEVAVRKKIKNKE